MKSKRLIGAMLAAGASLWASAASANLITIGLQEAGVNGGAITTVATGNGAAGVTGLPYGTFSFNSIDATGTPPLPQPELLANSINVNSDGGGTINVFVTEQGLTSPIGLSSFISSFTSNLLNGAITSVTEQTFASDANALFSGTMLASHQFTTIGTNVQNTLFTTVNPFSETIEFTIVATGVGNANSTVDLNASAVPEPASLAIFGSALAGLGLLRRRRRKNA